MVGKCRKNNGSIRQIIQYTSFTKINEKKKWKIIIHENKYWKKL